MRQCTYYASKKTLFTDTLYPYIPLELAASSLASMFAAVTCWSVSLGTATALDTLCSQSFTSHHPHTLGLHLQRAILVLMLLFVPIAGVWMSSEYVFLLLGQE